MSHPFPAQVSSASADAEVSSYTLGLEFDDVAEAKLAPAPAGTFQIGRVTFNSDAGFEKGRAVLDAGLRMGGSSVSGLAIELPLAEVLQKRVDFLSDTLDELVQPQLKQATATVEVHDRKLEEEREAVLALHVRLDAIEEIARALDAKPKHREGADQGLVDDLVTRVDAVESRLEKVERRDPGESRPVEVAPAGGGPDAGELASTVTETIMAELERIGLLVAKESETIGRVYEVSDECLRLDDAPGPAVGRGFLLPRADGRVAVARPEVRLPRLGLGGPQVLLLRVAEARRHRQGQDRHPGRHRRRPGHRAAVGRGPPPRGRPPRGGRLPPAARGQAGGRPERRREEPPRRRRVLRELEPVEPVRRVVPRERRAGSGDHEARRQEEGRHGRALGRRRPAEVMLCRFGVGCVARELEGNLKSWEGGARAALARAPSDACSAARAAPSTPASPPALYSTSRAP